MANSRLCWVRVATNNWWWGDVCDPECRGPEVDHHCVLVKALLSWRSFFKLHFTVSTVLLSPPFSRALHARIVTLLYLFCLFFSFKTWVSWKGYSLLIFCIRIAYAGCSSNLGAPLFFRLGQFDLCCWNRGAWCVCLSVYFQHQHVFVLLSS